MRLRARDIVAMLLVAAVLVPYVGYLVNGRMPLIDNSRAMASTGLLFGVLAFAIIRGGGRQPRPGPVEGGAVGLTVVLYVLAIALSETAAGELLLAAFVLCMMMVFALDLFDRDGPGHDIAPHP